MPNFGKTAPLTSDHFIEFEKCFGKDPFGNARRKDLGENGRFRCYSRKDIAQRNNSLDITWLRENRVDPVEELDNLEDIATTILVHLRSAVLEIESVVDELAGDEGFQERLCS